MKNNTLRLNLLLALLKPRTMIFSVVYLVLFALFPCFFSIDSAWMTLLVASIYPVYRIIFATKSLKLEQDVIRFTYTHYVRRFRRSVPVRVDYTVMNIRDLKFEQNSIEKLFNAGHISFTGRVFENSDSLYSDDINPKTSFTFYGLTDFKNTKKEVCNILGVNETE